MSPGRLLTQPGASPTTVYDENTDTTLGAVFQVRGTATAGQTMACYVVIDGEGTEMHSYTPAKTTPILMIETAKASGM